MEAVRSWWDGGEGLVQLEQEDWTVLSSDVSEHQLQLPSLLRAGPGGGSRRQGLHTRAEKRICHGLSPGCQVRRSRAAHFLFGDAKGREGIGHEGRLTMAPAKARKASNQQSWSGRGLPGPGKARRWRGARPWPHRGTGAYDGACPPVACVPATAEGTRVSVVRAGSPGGKVPDTTKYLVRTFAVRMY